MGHSHLRCLARVKIYNDLAISTPLRKFGLRLFCSNVSQQPNSGSQGVGCDQWAIFEQRLQHRTEVLHLLNSLSNKPIEG